MPRPRRRLSTVFTVVAFLLAGALAGCGADPAPPPEAMVISVSIVGGVVSPPPNRVPVAKGQSVQITVRCDVSDVVHVHGFDKTAALKPDTPATIEFVADQAGVFEVETHGSKLQLFQLAVS